MLISNLVSEGSCLDRARRALWLGIQIALCYESTCLQEGGYAKGLTRSPTPRYIGYADVYEISYSSEVYQRKCQGAEVSPASFTNSYIIYSIIKLRSL